MTPRCPRAHIVDSFIKPIRMPNGLKYGPCNEITVYGEQNIYELKSTYAEDPICMKGKTERDEDGK